MWKKSIFLKLVLKYALGCFQGSKIKIHDLFNSNNIKHLAKHFPRVFTVWRNSFKKKEKKKENPYFEHKCKPWKCPNIFLSQKKISSCRYISQHQATPRLMRQSLNHFHASVIWLREMESAGSAGFFGQHKACFKSLCNYTLPLMLVQGSHLLWPAEMAHSLHKQTQLKHLNKPTMGAWIAFIASFLQEVHGQFWDDMASLWQKGNWTLTHTFPFADISLLLWSEWTFFLTESTPCKHCVFYWLHQGG